jgi:quercetin dioxygenase-like cupin family protein
MTQGEGRTGATASGASGGGSAKLSELAFRELPGRASADPLALLGGGAAHGVAVRIVRMAAAPDRTPHRHPHSAEVVHVMAGRGTAWLEGARTAVGPGDTFVIPTGAAHATLPDLGETLELLCFFPHPDLGENIEELDGPALS